MIQLFLLSTLAALTLTQDNPGIIVTTGGSQTAINSAVQSVNLLTINTTNLTSSGSEAQVLNISLTIPQNSSSLLILNTSSNQSAVSLNGALIVSNVSLNVSNDPAQNLTDLSDEASVYNLTILVLNSSALNISNDQAQNLTVLLMNRSNVNTSDTTIKNLTALDAEFLAQNLTILALDSSALNDSITVAQNLSVLILNQAELLTRDAGVALLRNESAAQTVNVYNLTDFERELVAENLTVLVLNRTSLNYSDSAEQNLSVLVMNISSLNTSSITVSNLSSLDADANAQNITILLLNSGQLNLSDAAAQNLTLAMLNRTQIDDPQLFQELVRLTIEPKHILAMNKSELLAREESNLNLTDIDLRLRAINVTVLVLNASSFNYSDASEQNLTVIVTNNSLLDASYGSALNLSTIDATADAQNITILAIYARHLNLSYSQAQNLTVVTYNRTQINKTDAGIFQEILAMTLNGAILAPVSAAQTVNSEVNVYNLTDFENELVAENLTVIVLNRTSLNYSDPKDQNLSVLVVNTSSLNTSNNTVYNLSSLDADANAQNITIIPMNSSLLNLSDAADQNLTVAILNRTQIDDPALFQELVRLTIERKHIALNRSQVLANEESNLNLTDIDLRLRAINVTVLVLNASSFNYSDTSEQNLTVQVNATDASALNLSTIDATADAQNITILAIHSRRLNLSDSQPQNLTVVTYNRTKLNITGAGIFQEILAITLNEAILAPESAAQTIKSEANVHNLTDFENLLRAENLTVIILNTTSLNQSDVIEQNLTVLVVNISSLNASNNSVLNLSSLDASSYAQNLSILALNSGQLNLSDSAAQNLTVTILNRTQINDPQLFQELVRLTKEPKHLLTLNRSQLLRHEESKFNLTDIDLRLRLENITVLVLNSTSFNYSDTSDQNLTVIVTNSSSLNASDTSALNLSAIDATADAQNITILAIHSRLLNLSDSQAQNLTVVTFNRTQLNITDAGIFQEILTMTLNGAILAPDSVAQTVNSSASNVTALASDAQGSQPSVQIKRILPSDALKLSLPTDQVPTLVLAGGDSNATASNISTLVVVKSAELIATDSASVLGSSLLLASDSAALQQAMLQKNQVINEDLYKLQQDMYSGAAMVVTGLLVIAVFVI